VTAVGGRRDWCSRRYRAYTADALNLIAQKIHKATHEIATALDQSAATVEEISASVASTQLTLDMVKCVRCHHQTRPVASVFVRLLSRF
jgi:hypothetical protein